MKLMFLGAAHEVTGSCTLLTACGKNILIDCGMEQGPDTFLNSDSPVAPGEIDCILLTHAHIDHSGKLPLLCAQGFDGPIYSTKATSKLCSIMLLDSAHIQEFEAEWRNRKAKRAGSHPYVPLYTTEDAQNCITKFVGCDYGKSYEIADGISVSFMDAGHLLGSSNILLVISEDGIEKSLLFSGDIGNVKQPIINDPTYPKGADYVITESTYGTRRHDAPPDYATELANVLQNTFDRGGSVIIPSFAVGRTQEILYFIRDIKERGLIKGHGEFTVYVDSPLAIEATKIFRECSESCFDKEARELVHKGIDPISFEGLKVATTSDESRAINFDDGKKVIISASGMCEAGRIKHHLKHHLWREEDTVLFVGYQAARTLGRSLIEGAKKVKLFGEEVAVKAEIKLLPGISGHADSDGLIKWLTSMEKKPSLVFVNHGESAAVDEYAKRLKEEFGYETAAPYSGSCYNLADGTCIAAPKPRPVPDKAAETGERGMTDDFRNLIATADRLRDVAAEKRGHANAELRELKAKIERLIDEMQA